MEARLSRSRCPVVSEARLGQKRTHRIAARCARKPTHHAVPR
jgi:hypothetical protein